MTYDGQSKSSRNGIIRANTHTHLLHRYSPCRLLTSNSLSRRYGLMLHQTVAITELQELLDCPSYIYSCLENWD
jgi:hypothetical protein